MRHETDRDDWLRLFIGIILTVGGMLLLLAFDNADERAKCKSLRAQGVHAYVSDGLMSSECHVIQRDIVQEPAK